MYCRSTLLGLAVAIFLENVSLAATNVKQKDSEPTSISEEEARALATYTPIPRYPYEARAKHLTGTGLVRLDVDKRTGYVTSAQMQQSTGQPILDDEALKAFRAWRFKPGTVSAARIPVRFSMRRTQLVPGGGAKYGLAPEYPPEARAKGLIGRGIVLVKVDPRTGYVASAWMLKSTGHKILDNAALRAFRQWRFVPRSVTTVEIPVQFTSKGVFY